MSLAEAKYTLHKHGPASDGRLRIVWRPLYIDNGEESYHGSDPVKVSVEKHRVLMLTRLSKDGVVDHAVSKRLDNRGWRIADRVAEPEGAIGGISHACVLDSESTRPDLGAAGATSVVRAAVQNFIDIAAERAVDTTVEFVEIGSSGFISDSMLKCEWKVGHLCGLSARTCCCCQLWKEDHSGCLPAITRQ